MIFVYSHQNHMVFLYSDGKKEAVKYNIKTDSHKKITSSKSLYQFLEYSDSSYIELDHCYHTGLRVGNYFWIIFGGKCSLQNDNSWDENILRKPPPTILWSIKKEKWLKGPDLPEDFLPEDFYEAFRKMCSISVGINTAFVLNREHTFSFNFKNKIGRFHKSPPSLLVQGNGYDLESCALHLEKDYHRYYSMIIMVLMKNVLTK